MSKLTENRWYIYQKERFPLVSYFLMIASFSISAVGYASIVRGGKFSAIALITSFLTSFGFFALLRICDEHKDFEDDLKYRPYRPVQRGLVKLSELRNIGIVIIIIQLAFAIILDHTNLWMLLLLGIGWLYLFFMTKEFFVSKWLKAHPATYMLTHMVIMPITDFYASACDFVPNGRWDVAPKVIWYILSSFLTGIVIEVGRKLRAPEDEEEGVDTYSKVWGRMGGSLVWLGSMAAAMVLAFVATIRIHAALPAFIILPIVFIFNLVLCISYNKKPTTKKSKTLELMSGVWAIVEYMSIGILPLIFR